MECDNGNGNANVIGNGTNGDLASEIEKEVFVGRLWLTWQIQAHVQVVVTILRDFHFDYDFDYEYDYDFDYEYDYDDRNATNPGTHRCLHPFHNYEDFDEDDNVDDRNVTPPDTGLDSCLDPYCVPKSMFIAVSDICIYHIFWYCIHPQRPAHTSVYLSVIAFALEIVSIDRDLLIHLSRFSCHSFAQVC